MFYVWFGSSSGLVLLLYFPLFSVSFEESRKNRKLWLKNYFREFNRARKEEGRGQFYEDVMKSYNFDHKYFPFLQLETAPQPQGSSSGHNHRIELN